MTDRSSPVLGLLAAAALAASVLGWAMLAQSRRAERFETRLQERLASGPLPPLPRARPIQQASPRATLRRVSARPRPVVVSRSSR